MNTANPHLAGIQGQRMSTNFAPDKRLRIRIDLGQKSAGQNLPAPVEAPPRAEPKTIDIKLNGTTYSFRYWKTRWTNKATRRVYARYVLSYNDGLKPRQAKRSSFKALRSRAEEIATATANGETARLQLTPADQASFLCSRKLLSAVNKPLELVAGEYADCYAVLRGRSLLEAAKFYALHHPADVIKTCPEIYNEMIIALEKDGASPNTLADIRSRIGKWFVAKFPGPVTSLTAAEINVELRKLDVSRRTRNNYRGNIVDFVRYCKSNGHLPASWSVMENVKRVENEAVTKEIFTPEEIVKILGARMRIEARSKRCKSLIPFMAIGAWGHCRHEEMAPDNPRLARLDWRDVDFEAKQIEVTKDVARKIGRDRFVPMSKNLIAWLKQYAKPNGPVCELANPTNAMLAAAAEAGVKWKDNGLRKSSISYRLSIIKDIAKVADEAGTSVDRIYQNYKVNVPEREGKRWYNIDPTSADILQINFEAIMKEAQR